MNGFGKIFSLVAFFLYLFFLKLTLAGFEPRAFGMEEVTYSATANAQIFLFSQTNMFLKFWKLQNALFMQSYYDLAL